MEEETSTRIRHPVPQSSLLLSPGGKTQECQVSTVQQKFQTKKKNLVQIPKSNKAPRRGWELHNTSQHCVFHAELLAGNICLSGTILANITKIKC